MIAGTPGIDPGLLVTGGPGAETDSLTLTATTTSLIVTSNVAITSGDGCSNTAPAVITCAKPANPLGYVTVWGGDGPDLITVAGDMGETAVIVLSGGPGTT